MTARCEPRPYGPVPRDEAEARLPAAQKMVAAEEGWEARLAAGETTLEVFGVPAAE